LALILVPAGILNSGRQDPGLRRRARIERSGLPKGPPISEVSGAAAVLEIWR